MHFLAKTQRIQKQINLSLNPEDSYCNFWTGAKRILILVKPHSKCKCNTLTEKLIWLRSWLQQQPFIIFRKLFYQNVWIRPTFPNSRDLPRAWFMVIHESISIFWNIGKSLACVDSISSSILKSNFKTASIPICSFTACARL